MNNNNNNNNPYENEIDDGHESPSKSSSNNQLIEQDNHKSSTLPNYTSFGIEKSLSVNVDEGVNSDSLTPTNFSIYPSLRGRLFRVDDVVKCTGEWAMTDSAHGLAGQTSDFEFQLVNPTSNPISGKYTGWFHLKQPMKAPLKIEDKDLVIDFQKSLHGDNYDVTGSGQNKFGKFSLHGTFEPSTSKLQMYRVYTPKKTAPTPKSTKSSNKSSSNSNNNTSFASPRSTKVPSTPNSSITPSPRESLGQRVRKPSAVLTGSFEISTPTSAGAASSSLSSSLLNSNLVNSTNSTNLVPEKHHSNSNKRQHHEIETSNSVTVVGNSTSNNSNSTNGRAHRAPPFLAKCREILKELGKQAQSIYFNEPVDPIKLNIPDYLTIIKEPMDFSSIKKFLDNHFYTTHEQYAEHMRLVFRNAIAYNVRRDNPVHIAARELSDMFEERYRVMVSQLTAYSTNFEEPILPPPKKSIGRARSTKSLGARPTTGPRDFALDSSAQAMRMMQQKMLEMEAEINSLRTAVRQSDIRATLGHQMVAAQAPLTYEEKKILIANIMKLDGEQMTAVIDIIQSAMPTTACGDGDEVEIPVDELDTYTLRKLQDYVQNALASKSKKRNLVPSSPSVKSNGTKSQGSKRSRSSTGNININNNVTTPTNGAISIPPPLSSPTIPTTTPTPTNTPVSSLLSTASSMMPLPQSSFTSQNSNTQVNASSIPSFFSNQSYVPVPTISESETSKLESFGRKRSNSLDFFPVDDNDDNESSNVHIENSDAWKMVASNSSITTTGLGTSLLSPSVATLSSSNQIETQGLTRQPSDWGDALYEKQSSESRKMTLQVEAEKSKELRQKLEEERLAILALEREALQKSMMSNDNSESRLKELELLRQREKQNRDQLAATIEISDAHSALYSHNNNLYDL